MLKKLLQVFAIFFNVFSILKGRLFRPLLTLIPTLWWFRHASLLNHRRRNSEPKVRRRFRIICIKVKAPFADVSADVVKSVRIRLETPHFDGCSSIKSWAYFQNFVVEIILFNLIRIMFVEIRVVRARNFF